MPVAVRGLLIAVVVALWAGCAATPERDAQRLDAALRSQAVILFGEVHDNAAQHALRHAALARWIERGARPVLLMEQFDRERQAEIDRLLAEPGITAQRLIDAVGGRGWRWNLLEPTLALALTYRLPIVAANVSREDARRAMREGLGALGLDAQIAPDIEASIRQSIVDGHCGRIDAATAGSMVRGQVARDQVMAQLIERHAARGVVLLAGNGHVRSDVGVPRWLTPATRSRAVSIGLVEGALDAKAPYDLAITTAAQTRDDPCDGMRMPATRP